MNTRDTWKPLRRPQYVFCQSLSDCCIVTGWARSHGCCGCDPGVPGVTIPGTAAGILCTGTYGIHVVPLQKGGFFHSAFQIWENEACNGDLLTVEHWVRRGTNPAWTWSTWHTNWRLIVPVLWPMVQWAEHILMYNTYIIIESIQLWKFYIIYNLYMIHITYIDYMQTYHNNILLYIFTSYILHHISLYIIYFTSYIIIYANISYIIYIIIYLSVAHASVDAHWGQKRALESLELWQLKATMWSWELTLDPL